MFNLAQIQLRIGSAYHPQSNGQTERVNHCIETFLRCFVNVYPKMWLNYLSLAEYWYNTTFHSVIGISPFEALYEHSPRYFGISVENSSVTRDLD
jgi:transposase InsO family protein